MQIISERLRALRRNLGISQLKIGEMIGVKQSSVNRYESGQSVPSPKNMIWYADYFDVSLDYIYGRTDNPQGKLYSYEPKAIREQFEDEEKMKRFIEFCFEPGTSGNEKLKSVLAEMLGGKRK